VTQAGLQRGSRKPALPHRVAGGGRQAKGGTTKNELIQQRNFLTSWVQKSCLRGDKNKKAVCEFTNGCKEAS
jgi:hypothetical protein